MRRFVLAAAACVLSMAYTPAAFASSRARLFHAKLSVAGTNDEWTDSKIVVAPGDIVLVTVTGLVKIGKHHPENGPNGASNGDGRLVYKIGTSAGERTGEKLFVTVEQPGALKFKVQDSRYDDNSGAFNVDIVIIPAGFVPEPVVLAVQ
jgi:hypothetical protein